MRRAARSGYPAAIKSAAISQEPSADMMFVLIVIAAFVAGYVVNRMLMRWRVPSGVHTIRYFLAKHEVKAPEAPAPGA